MRPRNTKDALVAFQSRDSDRTGQQTIKSPLEKIAGEICLDGVSTLELAKKFGTPLYVMSERRIRENYRRFKSAFSQRYSRTRIFYSAKANTNLSILKVLKSEGAGIDVVSQGNLPCS